MIDENQSIQKNDNNKIKRTKNNLQTKIYYNQIINNIDLNNLISNTSSSINDSNNFKEENKPSKISPCSLNSLVRQQLTESHPNYIIILLYKELLSIISDSNISFYHNEYIKIINLLNNKSISSESIISIFKITFLKIIDEKVKELKENIQQYQSSIILLEQNNRYYIKQNYLKQTKIDILENEIDSYVEMEEEFDQMKEKLKYENGKFLHNEKKENEILILRAENSNLKKIIDKNEKIIEEKEHIIQSFKKKSASMINTNKNTMKNSFDFNDNLNNEHYSLVINKKNKIRPKQKLSHNNSNITNFNKINSPINIDNFNTNNNYSSNKSFNIKKVSFGEISKSNIKSDKKSSKELINNKIKNKVLNMKKLRRINDNCLNNYNKSTGHISNSIMSNNSNNNSNRKKIHKNIDSYFKSSKNSISFRINNMHKKLNSGFTNSNINNKKYINDLIKNHSNKIIVNSILENNDENKNKTKVNNNKSFLLKTSDRKFYIHKNKKNIIKTNLKQNNNGLILERNNYSLVKTPTAFNSHDNENDTGMKNNIIINNIIHNSSGVPIPGTSREKNKKEKIKISEFEHNPNAKQRISNNKSTKYLSVNIKNKKNKI